MPLKQSSWSQHHSLGSHAPRVVCWESRIFRREIQYMPRSESHAPRARSHAPRIAPLEAVSRPGGRKRPTREIIHRWEHNLFMARFLQWCPSPLAPGVPPVCPDRSVCACQPRVSLLRVSPPVVSVPRPCVSSSRARAGLCVSSIPLYSCTSVHFSLFQRHSLVRRFLCSLIRDCVMNFGCWALSFIHQSSVAMIHGPFTNQINA